MSWNVRHLLGGVVALAACGSDPAANVADGPLAGDASSPTTDGTGEATAPDAAIGDAPAGDIPVVDAAECREAVSELASLGWSRPCSAMVDAGIASPTCIGETPGLRVYRATCAAREVWQWTWGGTHGQTCYYDQGALVGVRLQNDTPAFCDGRSNGLVVGATEDCPTAPGTRILDCNPFVDSDWQPWSPDAR
jgi:hypothetical protein